MRHVQLIARSLVFAGFMIQSSVSHAAGVTVTLIPEESAVHYEAKAGVLKFDGDGTGVKGSFKISGPKAIEGYATFPLSTLKGQFEKRDNTMKEEVFVVKQYPEAKFVATDLPWKDPSQVLKQETDKAPFSGKITIRGVENPVSGHVFTQVVGDKVKYTFNFDVDLSKHGVEKLPSFAGVHVKPIVTVTVTTHAKVVVK
ncbi:YceI family protein [Oligoflexus tunisiensis]|uniref:YceI family protein n=1 Tax=Oligoflexus tunisiensis TaxID=708132 RepID=UPI00114CDB79|nr:YceI family protein [Oligoflexus tunisiensis]